MYDDASPKPVMKVNDYLQFFRPWGAGTEQQYLLTLLPPASGLKQYLLKK
jgi:hypothetical protein